MIAYEIVFLLLIIMLILPIQEAGRIRFVYRAGQCEYFYW